MLGSVSILLLLTLTCLTACISAACLMYDMLYLTIPVLLYWVVLGGQFVWHYKEVTIYNFFLCLTCIMNVPNYFILILLYVYNI